MSPGPVEEAGKVAGGIVESLKQQPLSLALVIMNLALLGFFWVILDRVNASNQRREQMLYDEQKEVRDLLSKCVIPERRTDLFFVVPVADDDNKPP